MSNDESEMDVAGDARKALCLILKREVRLIDYLIHALSTGASVKDQDALKADKKVLDVVLMMVQGMGVSTHSILKLSECVDMQVRDSLVLSRAVVETAINVAYIIAGGPKLAELAQRHALQKTFRSGNRSGRLGGINFVVSSTPSIDPSHVAGLEDALKEFTNARGTEKRQWTSDNIDKRLELIASKFERPAIALTGAMLTVYRDSSEILHGTFFGVTNFWTRGGGPVGSRREAEKLFFSKHFVPALSAAFLALFSVVRVADIRYGIKAIAKAQNENFGYFQELIEQLDEYGL